MTKFTGFFVKMLAVFVSMFLLIAAPAAVKDGVREEKPADCLYAFNVISDAHIETNNYYRKDVYVQILRNMKEYTPDTDALVMLGDNVMNGQITENLILNGLTDMLFPTDKRLMVCGNHDSGNMSGKFDQRYKRYINFHNWFSGADEIDKGWFSFDAGACTFIFLCSEEDTDFAEYMSREQYDWFLETLEAAAETGRPVFVCNHYPEGWVYVEGDDDLDLIDPVRSYDNVYYFNGHLHPGGVWVGQNSEANWSIMLPRVTECDEDDGTTYDWTGKGLRVYVMEDEVVIKIMNFYTAQVVETITVPII